MAPRFLAPQCYLLNSTLGVEMAHSLLMVALQRLAREHAEASWRGIEIARVREERAIAAAGRRRFLQGVRGDGGRCVHSANANRESRHSDERNEAEYRDRRSWHRRAKRRAHPARRRLRFDNLQVVEPHRGPHALKYDNVAEPAEERMVR